MKHLNKLQHYANVICVEYPDEPWKHVELRSHNEVTWRKMHNHPTWSEEMDYRFVLDVIEIGGHEVPKPLKYSGDYKGKYYFPTLHRTELFDFNDFDDDYTDREIFHKGIAHSTKEAAIIHAKALLSLMNPEGK